MGVLDWYIDKIFLVWVEYRVHRVMWVPAGADSLKTRLLVCAHLEGAGDRRVDATMAQLERHCMWDRGKILPQFTVGDYVLVDRVSRQGKRPSLRALGPDRGVLPTKTKSTRTQCSTWSQPNCATSTW